MFARIATSTTIARSSYARRSCAHKRSGQVGEVRISQHTEEQDRSIEVPLTNDVVTIERHAGNHPADADPEAGQRIRVPVNAEDAELDKRARVYEEIDVDEQAAAENKRIGEG